MENDHNIWDGVLQPGFIHFDKGQCPLCSGPIIVVQSEISSSRLSKVGLPITYDVENYRAVGYCNNCNRQFPVIKKDMAFEVIVDERIHKMYDMLNDTEDESDSSIDEDSPFIKKG